MCLSLNELLNATLTEHSPGRKMINTDCHRKNIHEILDVRSQQTTAKVSRAVQATVHTTLEDRTLVAPKIQFTQPHYSLWFFGGELNSTEE